MLLEAIILAHPTDEQLRTAFAVDALCSAMFPEDNSSPARIGLKMAVMLRMGADNLLAMLAAIDATDLYSQHDQLTIYQTAKSMAFDPDHTDFLLDIENRARGALKALSGQCDA